MTVPYTDTIASRSSFDALKLLLRWRGSVYKMVWRDILVYMVCYFFISLVYRLVLPEEDRRVFECLVIHCERFRSLLPLSFVLGFYVALVVSRWWGMYQSLPWPATTAMLLAAHVQGSGEAAREVRTTLLRHINLGIALTFRLVSPVVKTKLPTLDHLRVEGFMSDHELRILEAVEQGTDQHVAWVPFTWACRAVERAAHDDLIRSDLAQKALTDEILTVRRKCHGFMGYLNYNIPLVYTQVATIAVYSYFIVSLFGEQFLDPRQGYEDHKIDFYVPIFALLQMIMYIGWLKVAHSLLNPAGEDDDDFELMKLLENHRKMSTLLCDPIPDDFPNQIQAQRDIDDDGLAVTSGREMIPMRRV
ncbi:bestrophin-2-like [Panulirus ornatus]|uniref:bestrophin-2-like n=1 Tax=Panulirus ornatus TaxID=150431 RepID=UPI003A874786